MKYVVSAFLAIIFALPLVAQLDPRERYGTYVGGGVAREYNGDCPDPNLCATTFPADTVVDRVTVDSSGNVYVAGTTTAIDFPVTSGAYRTSPTYACEHSSTCDSSSLFVAKFNASGQRVWSTYVDVPSPGFEPWIGGVNAIGVDTSGNIELAGGAVADLCGNYPFVVKLNSTGSARLYANILACDDYSGAGIIPNGAAIDSTGRYFYLAISDTDGSYPVTSGANPADPGSPQERLVKIDSQKATNGGVVYVAGTNGLAGGVAVNSLGYAFLLTSDTRVEKFNSLGALVFSVKYLPSFATSSSAGGIMLASNGDILFAATASPQGIYPSTSSFGTITPGAATDTLVVRLNGSNGSRVFATAIHDADMIPSAIARDSADEPFVTGANTGFRYSVNRYSNAPSKGVFLARLNSTGTKVWIDSTFGGDADHLEATDSTWNAGIAVDAAWNAWVGGKILPGQFFPLTSNAFQASFKNAHSQGFLAKLIIEADAKMLIQGASPNPVTHGANLTYTLAVYNNGPDVSNGDTITDVLPAGTTFVSYSTTNGTCTHPAVGYGGTFKCTRSTALNKGSYWGPIKLTVKVNAAAGTTLKNTASVAAKTQDVVPSNNTATVYVKVQ